MLKYYIATTLNNAHEHRLLSNVIKNNIYSKLTYDWTRHGSVLDDPIERRAFTAFQEVEGVRSADVVIAILPGGRGTHIEIGAALALRRSVIIVYQNAQDLRCVFYDHPLVQLIYKGDGWSTVVDAIRELPNICRCKGLYTDHCRVHTEAARGNVG